EGPKEPWDMTREEYAESLGYDSRNLPIKPIPMADARSFPITRDVDIPLEKHIRQALREGKLTPERAEELGHFDAYPELRDVKPEVTAKWSTQPGLDEGKIASEAADVALKEPPSKMDSAAAQAELDELMPEIEAMKQADLLSEDDLARLEEAELYAKQEKQNQDIIQAAFECLTRKDGS
ncbi:hypothetical protein HWQ67_09135, partial [Candidatus Magnetobacterium casensis]